MKQIRKLTMLVLILGMLLSLTGCKENLSEIMTKLPGFMNVEKLMVKYEEVNGDRALTEMAFSVPLSGKATMDEETIEFDLLVEGFNRMEDEFHEYSEIQYEADIDAQWYCNKIKTYFTVEGDEVVSYKYYSLEDVWERVTSGLTTEKSKELAEMLEASVAKIKTEEYFDPAKLVLLEEKEIVCNREVYVLEYPLTGEELQCIYNGMELEAYFHAVYSAVSDGEVPAENDESQKLLDAIKDSALFDLNLKNLQLNYRQYIDAETFELVQEEFELIGLDGLVDGMIDGVMTLVFDIMDEMEVEYDKEEMPEIFVDVDDITIVVNSFGYDPITVPEVPEEGIILTAQAEFNPDMGDGTYVIQEYGDAVRISVPEGWLPEVNGYYGLTLTKQDANQMAIWGATESAVFTMYSNEEYTEEELKASITEYEEYYKSLGIYHETTMPEVEGYTVYRVNNMRLNAYYAWKPVGDGWLFVEYYDVTVQPMENTFLQMLQNVSDYDLKIP